MSMNFRNQINAELHQVCMSEELKAKIRSQANTGRRAGTLPPRPYRRAAVLSLLLFLLGSCTVFSGYICHRVIVNEAVLPDLDPMYPVRIHTEDMDTDQYGQVKQSSDNYKELQRSLGISLLNSPLSEGNPYMRGKITSDRKDFAMITFENYILGDTKDYTYLPEESRFTYTPGTRYLSPVSLTVEMMLSEEQMENGWDTDYLGMYRFSESYTSSQGYRVNLIESTGQNGLSEKCAVFVADGIRYTLRGRVSFQTIKEIVDSME